MRADIHAPSHWHVIAAIARRETAIASRRKLVRLFFLFSILPPLVMGVVLVVRVMVREVSGMDLGWDPVFRTLQAQAFPVGVLALGLGTPAVARDRAEDVLYLYAVRPVLPWHYAAGKLLTVALSTFLLLAVPGMLLAGLRIGILGEAAPVGESLLLVAKVFLASLLMGLGFSGLSVGASAAVKRARWALLLAIACFIFPEIVGLFVWGPNDHALTPDDAAMRVLESLFDGRGAALGLAGAAGLLVYGAIGYFTTLFRVRTEMTP